MDASSLGRLYRSLALAPTEWLQRDVYVYPRRGCAILRGGAGETIENWKTLPELERQSLLRVLEAAREIFGEKDPGSLSVLDSSPRRGQYYNQPDRSDEL